MSTPGGLVDKQELIDAQLDTAHLGRVVNSKDASGNPINTSTNRTGGVNKTLDALEAEYEQSIVAKESEADAVIDTYRLRNKGPYAAGITLESEFEFITYEGESYFAVNPPYTTTATLPGADTNLFVGGYTTLQNVSEVVDVVFTSIADLGNSGTSEVTLSAGSRVETKEYYPGTGYGGGVYVIVNSADRPNPDSYADIVISGTDLVACLDANHPIDLRSFGTKDDPSFDSSDRINNFYKYVPLNESNVESVVYNAYGVVHISNTIFTGVADSSIRKAHRFTNYNLAVYTNTGATVETMMSYVYQNQCSNDGQLRITGAARADGEPFNFLDRKCDFGLVVGNGVSDADLPNIDLIGCKLWGVVTSKDESPSFGGFSSVFNNVSCRFCGTGSNTDPSHPQNDASVITYTSASYVNGTSVGQRTRLALPALPYNAGKYAEASSYVEIGGYLYWIDSFDVLNNTVDIYPNIKSTELAGGDLQFFYGGAFLNTGSNSAFANVKGTLKGIGCGIVLFANALYPGTFKNVQAEVNGIGFAHVGNYQSAAVGGLISELYCEGCKYDAVSAASANNAYFKIEIAGPSDFVNKFINHGIFSYRLPNDEINKAINTGVNLSITKGNRNYTSDVDQFGVIVGEKTNFVGTFTVSNLPTPFEDLGMDATIGAKLKNRTIVDYEYLMRIPSTSLVINLPSVASGYTFRTRNNSAGDRMTWDNAYFTTTLGWGSQDGLIIVTHLNEQTKDYDVEFIRCQKPADGVIT